MARCLKNLPDRRYRAQELRLGTHLADVNMETFGRGGGLQRIVLIVDAGNRAVGKLLLGGELAGGDIS